MVAWIGGGLLGWVELDLAAASGVTVLLLSLVFVLGRTQLSIETTLEPSRVIVGEPSAGQVVITNVARGRLLPVRVEVAVGQAAARFDVPSLPSGHAHEETIVVPTHRRGVVVVGPAMSVRGDPLGLMRRAVLWGTSTELFVHPRTVPLDTLGSGFLRDLDGQASSTTSPSDLAFHTLRGYEPGDDWRHIHWRTTARTGQLMVRQFVDTRQSHLALVVDGDLGAFLSADDVELAVSAAGSLGLRAIRDQQGVSVVAAGHSAARVTGRRLLDTLARAEPVEGGSGLVGLASRASRLAPDASIAVLVTGGGRDITTLRAACARFSLDTRVLALVVQSGGQPSSTRAGMLSVLTLGVLHDLGALIRSASAP